MMTLAIKLPFFTFFSCVTAISGRVGFLSSIVSTPLFSALPSSVITPSRATGGPSRATVFLGHRGNSNTVLQSLDFFFKFLSSRTYSRDPSHASLAAEHSRFIMCQHCRLTALILQQSSVQPPHLTSPHASPAHHISSRET